MKKIFLLITALCLLLSGCSEGLIPEPPTGVESKIIVRVLNVDPTTGSTTKQDVLGQVVFTGNDILWFNETTKELRFKDNMSNNPAKNPVLFNTQVIGFYMDGEFMFSSVYVNSSSLQTFDCPVLYYNTVENKYFLLDGYPPDSNLQDPATTSPEKLSRRENWNIIVPEWSKFVNQLKEEKKYKD